MARLRGWPVKSRPLSLPPLWPAVICVGWAWATIGLNGCGSGVATSTINGINDAIARAKADEYGVLTIVAWRCTIAAVVMVVVAAGVEAATSGLPFPFVKRIVKALRAMAATSVACAVGAWVLKLCLEQLHFYLPWAIGLTVLCGLATLGLYVWGHRKVFRKRLGV